MEPLGLAMIMGEHSSIIGGGVGQRLAARQEPRPPVRRSFLNCYNIVAKVAQEFYDRSRKILVGNQTGHGG